MDTKRVIVGAGPAGLAVAARCRVNASSFEIVEQSQNIGNSWCGHYDRLCLHTVKKYSALPYLPFPKDYPQFVPRDLFIEYLEEYARHFKINPRFEHSVTQVVKQDKGGWAIKFKDRPSIHSQEVIFATGANRIPHIPEWPGKNNFAGTIIHSRAYKRPAPYKDKKVLVIGFGNTGAEIALDLANYEIETGIVVRSPANIVPREINGRPTQITGKILEMLPFGIGDTVGKVIRNIVVGNLKPYGIKTSTLSPAEQLKKTGKTPVIDLGTIAHIKAGNIKVYPDVKAFKTDTIEFENGQEVSFDAVILATGYRPKIESIVPKSEDLLDANGMPTQPIGRNYHSGLYFIGFDNYKVGGILGTIQTDSKTIIEHLIQSKSV